MKAMICDRCNCTQKGSYMDIKTVEIKAEGHTTKILDLCKKCREQLFEDLKPIPICRDAELNQ